MDMYAFFVVCCHSVVLSAAPRLKVRACFACRAGIATPRTLTNEDELLKALTALPDVTVKQV